MSNTLRGPHHCIGTAHSVMDMTFRYLDDFCSSRGGSLSAADLDAAHARLHESIAASCFDWIDTIHRNCMNASASTAVSAFGPNTILVSLLSACGDQAAQEAFSAAIDRYGAQWLTQFYEGLAQYIRRHVCIGVDGRLIRAYAKVAGKRGANLLLADMMTEQPSRSLLRECFGLFVLPGAADALAKSMTDELNRFFAGHGAGGNAGLYAVRKSEVSRFLQLFRRQVESKVGSANGGDGPASLAEARTNSECVPAKCGPYEDRRHSMQSDVPADAYRAYLAQTTG